MLVLSMAAFTAATVAAVVWLGVRTGRRQAAVAPNWWIPLFLKSAVAAAVTVGLGSAMFQFAWWSESDADVQLLLNRGVILRQERHSDHTTYFLDSDQSGSWSPSLLNRYDFKFLWEPVALFATIGGIIGGAVAVTIGSAISLRKRRRGFPVLEPK